MSLELNQKIVHGVDRSHTRDSLTKDPGCGQRLLTQQQLLTAGGARHEIDGREDSPLCQLSAQHQLAVAGSLELLENHLIHLAAGIDQRRRYDGERPFTLRWVY